MKNKQSDEQRRIVVGMDGFQPSKAALRWAIHQAKLTGAMVEAITAWHIPVGTGWVPPADMPDYQNDAFAVLSESITEMCAVDPDVEVCPRVVEGRAGQVLVDATHGADLLVVGSQGSRRPGRGAAWLGRPVLCA
jgi:nucleotide-binding universal stress UspA family protein